MKKNRHRLSYAAFLCAAICHRQPSLSSICQREDGLKRVGWEGDFQASEMKIKMKFQIQIDFFLFHFHRRVAFAALMEFLSKLLGVLDLMLFYLFLVLLLCKMLFFCAPWMTMWIYILNNPTHSIHNLLHKFTQSSLIPMMMIFLCCCRRRWVEFQIPTLSLTSALLSIDIYFLFIFFVLTVNSGESLLLLCCCCCFMIFFNTLWTPAASWRHQY